MQRVTEPELMTAPHQVKAYAEADFSLTEGNIISCLKKLLQENQIVVENETLIIDLGCGPGNISEKLATCWPSSKVIGIDDSSEMLKVAKKRQENIKRVSELEGLVYVKKNLSSLAIGHSLFHKSADIVVSNSLLHHIHDPTIFFKALLNISKRGTLHFHRDLRRPISLDQVLLLQKKYLLNAPSILKRDFSASLEAAYTVKEVELEINKAGINNFNVIEVDDRYLDIKGVID